MRGRFWRLKAGLTALMLALPGRAGGAEIKVLCDVMLEPAMAGLVEAFKRQSKDQVNFSFGATRVIRSRVTFNEPADVAITQPRDIEELTGSGKLLGEGQVVVAQIGVGLAMREGVALPDISTKEALVEAVLRADTLLYPTLPPGIYFAELLERLGVADKVKEKSTRHNSVAASFDELLRRKGNDIGVGLTTQIAAYRRNGLRLVGPLPAELQSTIPFTAAAMLSSKSPEIARSFLKFLASPAAKAAFAAIGAN
jgi:molybdate transport system substrate-binding protein